MLSRMSKRIKGFSQDISSHEILHKVTRQRQAFIIFLKKTFTWRSCRKPSVFPILYLVGFGKLSVHSQVTIIASLLLIAGGTISFTSAPAFAVTIVSRNHCRQKNFAFWSFSFPNVKITEQVLLGAAVLGTTIYDAAQKRHTVLAPRVWHWAVVGPVQRLGCACFENRLKHG